MKLRRSVACVAVATALGVALGSRSSHACTCAPASSSEQIEGASDIFVGQVVSLPARTPAPPADAGRPGTVGSATVLKSYALEVSETLKGSLRGRIEVSTPSDAAACGFSFADGETYMVFARKAEPAGLQTDLCRGNVSGAAIAAKVEEVRRFGSEPRLAEPTPPGP